MRELANENIERILIDDAQKASQLKLFLSGFDAGLAERCEFYSGEEPIFEKFDVETEITRAMSRKVWLRSGGYLVIDQAEALTVVDVNTGKFVGKRDLEDTIVRTNLEAVKEVAYQLRLRNIGGMVIIDFIDMDRQDHRDRVLAALIDALNRDRAKCNVIKMSEIGLVEMTRQRTRESLERETCELCFYYDGKGMLKSRRTIAYEIFRTLKQKAADISEPAIIVHAHPEVVDLIYNEETPHLSHLEKLIHKQIAIKPRGSFHQEHYDMFGTRLTGV
jgi:ribonuclease G